jgi:hypothetical protein
VKKITFNKSKILPSIPLSPEWLKVTFTLMEAFVESGDDYRVQAIAQFIDAQYKDIFKAPLPNLPPICH